MSGLALEEDPAIPRPVKGPQKWNLLPVVVPQVPNLVPGSSFWGFHGYLEYPTGPGPGPDRSKALCLQKFKALKHLPT